jgi:precorrin-6A/cobalt-precorrin-6A reductase
MKSEQTIALRSAKLRAHRVLILGGTGEASQLAARLRDRSDVTVISSLAGRVEKPAMPAGTVRTGGFGGVPGLIEYLTTQRIDVVIDATHPFAAKISSHAELACKQTKIPLIAFERPAWIPQKGDRWVQVPDVEGAAALVIDSKNRVFLSVGRQELAAFSECSNAWFLIRTIDKPTVPLPPRYKLLLSRGPFHLDEERRLLRSEAITHIVSKNSGGGATYAKIIAARELGIEIIMVDRPTIARTTPCSSIEEVYLQFEDLLKDRPTLQLEPTEITRL